MYARALSLTHLSGLRVDSNIIYITVGIIGHTIDKGMVLMIAEGGIMNKIK